MTDPEARLAAVLPCEDPEEPCDADGRDAHIWCAACIARHRIAADPTLAADFALAAAVARLRAAMAASGCSDSWALVALRQDGSADVECHFCTTWDRSGSTLAAAIEEALRDD